MTDYAEDQENELMALESMYPDELTVINPHPSAKYKVNLISQAILRSKDEPIRFDLIVAYTEKYPDEMPIFEIGNEENFANETNEELLELCQEQGNSNLGMPFVFSVISSLQDRIEEIVERINEKEIEEEEKEIRETEAAQEKLLVGTPVTIETFLKWKEKFDAEMYEKRRIEELEKEKLSTKLTGLQYFQKNKTDDTEILDEVLEGEDPGIAVDESLFENMDNLGLEELSGEES